MFIWPRPTLIALSLTLIAVTTHVQAQDDETPPPPWSDNDISATQAQCKANMTASSGIEGPKVTRYCECITEALQARFTFAEVRKMRREHDAGDSEDTRPPQLAKTLEQCSPVLESQ